MNGYFCILHTIKFVEYYNKIDLAKKMAGNFTDLKINCPKIVARFFFFFFHY